MELKEWVRAARNHAGLTIEQLAVELNRSKAAAGFWETGATKPSYQQMARISAVTGYPMPGDVVAPPRDDIAAARSKKWPFKRIDFEKLTALSATQAKNLENAMLVAAGDLDLDIRVAHSAKRKAA